MFNASEKWEQIVGLWPKKQGELYWGRDRIAFDKRVKSDEDFEKLKNHLECVIEDTPVSKLGNLSDIIHALFKHTKNSVTVAEKPVLDQTELYQKTNNPELSKTFTKIWEVWPRMPDFVERRNLALDAFLVTAKVLPLPDIETACLAYANAFGDGSMVYPKSLRNFLSDKELIKEWLDRSKSQKENEEDRKQFEVVYAWYPEFVGKNINKTKDASWVMYWRNIKNQEKLDFLAMVKLYRRMRKNEAISRDQSEEESAIFTKSFVAFVSEFRQMFTGNRVFEAKADIFAYQVISYAREIGLDFNNIWGEDDISPFFVRVLTYLCSVLPNIHEVIHEGLLRTFNLVKEVKENPKKYNNISRLEQAIKETERLDVDNLCDILYNKICETELYKLPVKEVVND